jgi:hypothetical protein
VSTGHRPRPRHAAPRRGHAAPRRGRARSTNGAGRRLAVLASAVPVGLLACCGLVWQSSYAAFVGTTSNPGDSWQTGVVALRNDRPTPLFTIDPARPIVPGSTGAACITVDYTGDVTTAETGVRLYGTVTSDYTPLLDALQITVQVSRTSLSPAPAADCTGFDPSPAQAITYLTSAFSAFPVNYGTGLGDLNTDGFGDWRPSPAVAERSRTYKISYRFPTNPPSGSYATDYQGKKVQMSFTWEVQSDDTPGT